MAVSEGNMYSESLIGSTLRQCCYCGRSFIPASLEKHEKICERTFINKRKIFNSQNQRIQDDKINLSARTNSKDEAVLNDTYRKTRWREKHEDLISTIRAARGIASAEKSGKPAPPLQRSLIPSDYVLCEYCQRHFSPKSADRHIAWCKEQKTRVGQSTKVAAAARERLEARTKYKAPTLRRKSTSNKVNQGKPPANGSSYREMERSNNNANVKVRGKSISPPSRVENGDGRNNWKNSKINTNFKVPSSSNYNAKSSLKQERSTPSLKTNSSRESYDPFMAAEQQMRDLLLDGSSKSTVNTKDHSRTNYYENRSLTSRGSMRNQLPVHNQSASRENPHLRRSTIQVRDKEPRVDPGRRTRHNNNLSDSEEESLTPYSERGSGDLRSTYTLISSSNKLNNNSRHYGVRNSIASQESDCASIHPCRNSPSPPLKLPSAVTTNNKHHHHHQRQHGHSTARAYEQQQDQRLSTSSSDSSLPPLKNQRNNNNMKNNNKNKRHGHNSTDGWTACFCHECGTCYPVATAKFCCECGTKRICSI